MLAILLVAWSYLIMVHGRRRRPVLAESGRRPAMPLRPRSDSALASGLGQPATDQPALARRRDAGKETQGGGSAYPPPGQ